MTRWVLLMIGLWIVIFIAGLLLGGGAVALFWWAYESVVSEQTGSPLADLGIQRETLEPTEVDQYIDRLGKSYHLDDSGCLAVAIVVGDETRFHYFGTLPSGAAPTQDTIFELASVGKTFTGLLLAEMIVKNELSSSATIDELWPQDAGVAPQSIRAILLFDLATHSSGIPSLPRNMPASNPLNPYAGFTVPLMYEDLQTIKLDFAPRRGYAYSNFGFGLLGHLLALRAGKSYEELVVERICRPLNMEDTRMTLSAGQLERVATPHDGGKPVSVWEDTTMPGAGSFLSSPGDMAKYIRGHWSGELGSLATAMGTAIRKHRRTDLPQTAIGYAWHINSENALDIVWHNGGSGGSRSYVALLPDRRVGVCVLANWSTANVEEFGRKLIYLLLMEAINEPQI